MPSVETMRRYVFSMASWMAQPGADLEVHLEPGGAAEIVEGHHVQGIGGGDDEPPAVALRGDDAVLARDLLGHELDDVEVEALAAPGG